MAQWGLAPDLPLRILLWSAIGLAATLVLLVIATGLLQHRADRRNAQRIAAFRGWEAEVPEYLFGDGPVPEAFLDLPPEQHPYLRNFLQRLRNSVGGLEGERLKSIYQEAGLDRDLPQRLEHRAPRIRATAALEVWAFGLEALLPKVQTLLDDPVAYVAYAAARTLSRSKDLNYAGPVFEWVSSQEQYQQNRMLAVMEDFGPTLVPRLASHLEGTPISHLRWRLFALLVASHRVHGVQPALERLLDSENVEVQCAAIKAFHAIGDPGIFPRLAPFANHQHPLLRMHLAQASGSLGGAAALPLLMGLMEDPVFDIRRHASRSLAELGPSGREVLRWIAQDPTSDPFARDMALERLEWLELRGRL